MAASNQDFPTLKTQLKATWSTGDYGVIARGLQASAEAFVRDLGIVRGNRVLDVACGSGQAAIPVAELGAEAVGIDIVEAWIDQAKARAARTGLNVRFDVGDAEDMPYDDASFDVVVSLIGAMFTPRPEVTAAEMARVCRPGGRIIMANWTPEGFIGAFFKIVAKYAPPPDMPSPLLWGSEDVVRERFEGIAANIDLSRRDMHFSYPMPPAELVEHYFEYFGPTHRAYVGLDDDGRKALRGELEELWRTHNQAPGDRTEVDAEILKVDVTRI